jgi:hypothetical protein
MICSGMNIKAYRRERSVSKSVHKGFVHLTIRGRLYCSLGRAASVLMLCGLI